MPWYFPWSENIKKGLCRYLLHRFLGQFLEEKLTLDQLTVDLYNGIGSVSDVALDVNVSYVIHHTFFPYICNSHVVHILTFSLLYIFCLVGSYILKIISHKMYVEVTYRSVAFF